VKIGFFSPLPPARTGVADYSAALLRELRKLAVVEPDAEDGGISLYHIGNNSLHREIYRRALERPGVAVIHDAVLHHFFLGSLPEREYIEEFCFNYGPWTETQAAALWRNRPRSAADPAYFSYPMVKRIAEASLGVIVHNPGAAAMVRAHAKDARIFEIPHLHTTPEHVSPLSLGFPAGAFVFGVFGHLRESKRVLPILRAFEKVSRQTSAALLLAGDFASSDLERSVRPLLARPGILHAGYQPEHEFLRYANACDACISLRYPAAGETSGITIRLMGLGKPVVLSAGLETSRFPGAACIRIDSGPAEEEMLEAAMLWLATHRGESRQIGRLAAAHIAEHHGADRAAQAYLQAILACYHQKQ
jgi:glycosyltransferase involved in cell wall biosynthesis